MSTLLFVGLIHLIAMVGMALFITLRDSEENQTVLMEAFPDKRRTTARIVLGIVMIIGGIATFAVLALMILAISLLRLGHMVAGGMVRLGHLLADLGRRYARKSGMIE